MAGGGNPTMQAQPNVYQQAAQGVGQAGQVAGQVAQYNPAQFGQQVGQFQNPYTQQVTDQTMMDLERQRQMASNATGAAASAAGAFGGSRHGVADALTNQGFANTAAQTYANLNNQGFQNSVQNMFGAQNQALSGAQNLSNIANLGFGMGQQLQNQQYQYGAQQQAMQQALIDAAKGQFASFTGSPQASLATQLGAIGGVPYGQSQSTSQTPGLFNLLSLGLGL